ncbi:hypothetical protein C8R47DRAFT_1076721 [Mycena vitilis]|nr:hypothetical protein C8R47DRAFT_1076721 [Mycena vitilis]
MASNKILNQPNHRLRSSAKKKKFQAPGSALSPNPSCTSLPTAQTRTGTGTRTRTKNDCGQTAEKRKEKERKKNGLQKNSGSTPSRTGSLLTILIMSQLGQVHSAPAAGSPGVWGPKLNLLVQVVKSVIDLFAASELIHIAVEPGVSSPTRRGAGSGTAEAAPQARVLDTVEAVRHRNRQRLVSATGGRSKLEIENENEPVRRLLLNPRSSIRGQVHPPFTASPRESHHALGASTRTKNKNYRRLSRKTQSRVEWVSLHDDLVQWRKWCSHGQGPFCIKIDPARDLPLIHDQVEPTPLSVPSPKLEYFDVSENSLPQDIPRQRRQVLLHQCRSASGVGITIEPVRHLY